MDKIQFSSRKFLFVYTNLEEKNYYLHTQSYFQVGLRGIILQNTQ